MKIKNKGQAEIPIQVTVDENKLFKIIGDKAGVILVPAEKKDSKTVTFYLEAVEEGESETDPS
jgi:hypothetical protein